MDYLQVDGLWKGHFTTLYCSNLIGRKIVIKYQIFIIKPYIRLFSPHANKQRILNLNLPTYQIITL